MLPIHESLKEERFTAVKEGFLAICTYIEKGKVKTNTCAAFHLNLYVNRHNDFAKKNLSQKEAIKLQSSTSYLEKCLLYIFSQKTIKEANKFLASANLITIHRSENNNIHESNYVSINLCAIQAAEKPYHDTFIVNAFDPQIVDGKLVFNGGGLGKFTEGGRVNLPKGLGKFTHTNINTTIRNKDKKESSPEDFFDSNFLEEEAKETPKSDFLIIEKVTPPPALSEKECSAMVYKWIKANEAAYVGIKTECKYISPSDEKQARNEAKMLVDKSIAFWLESDKFAAAFRANPSSFFAANFKKSLLKLLKEDKSIGRICRDKNTVSTLLKVRYPTYNLHNSDWHVNKLCEPLSDAEFEFVNMKAALFSPSRSFFLTVFSLNVLSTNFVKTSSLITCGNSAFSF